MDDLFDLIESSIHGMLTQVAVYALLKTAIELEILLSQERQNESSPVRNM